MKSIKLINAVLLIIFLVSCASEPLRDEPSSTSPKKMTSKPPKPTPVPPPKKEETNQYVSLSPDDRKLEAALKSRSDNDVLIVVGDRLARNSKEVKVLNALALHHYQKGRIKLAKIVIDRALEGASKNQEKAVLNNNLGVFDLHDGKEVEAIAYFKKALEYDSDSYAANLNLGTLYLRNEAYQKAYPLLHKAYEQKPEGLSLLNNYAIVTRDSKDYTLAQNIYEKILKTQPAQPIVMLNYSILLIDYMNKPDKGMDFINRLKFMGVDSQLNEKIIALEKRAKSKMK